METNEGQCRLQPSVWFLMATLVLTSAATAILCAAIMTDHWEHVTWDRGKLEAIALKHRNASNQHKHKQQQWQWILEWILDGKVARLVYTSEEWLQRRKHINKLLKTSFKSGSVAVTVQQQDEQRDEVSVFLIPMHGGIWTLCVTLTDEQRELLIRVGFTQTKCVNYLSPEMNKGEEGRADWQHRMQNLSISCALVCLIILGSSALVGAFGVLKHQISAVLVTGVMYLLAATFAIFTLAIIHFKRQQIKHKPEMTVADCMISSGTPAMLIDGVSLSAAAVLAHLQVESEIFTARVLTTSWSLDLGRGGVVLCVLASVMWIALSKIMRYNPLSTMPT